jgi:hypothetical protein
MHIPKKKKKNPPVNIKAKARYRVYEKGHELDKTNKDY